MSWILFAFAAPMLFGVAVVLDNQLSNSLFKNVWVLSFYAILLSLVFLPLVWVVSPPQWPTLALLPYFILIGVLQVFYLVPYYAALRHTDPSVVTSLFSLGRVFVPILAFFVLMERLSLVQYLGFGLVIIASTLLTYRGRSIFRPNKAFWYMGISAFVLAVEAVTFKHVFNTVDWSTGFVWPLLFSAAFVSCFMLVPKLRRQIMKEWPTMKRNWFMLSCEEFFTFMGFASMTYAESLTSVSRVTSINAIEPFVVLFYAVLFRKRFPKAFRHEINHDRFWKKIFLFAMTLIGTTLILQQSL